MSVVDEIEVQAIPEPRRRAWLVVIPLTALVSVAATLGVVQFRDRDQTAGPDYASTRQMAERLGCTATFESAARPGGSLSAGRCTYRGAEVDLRIYATAGETAGWFDGSAEADPHAPGVYAGRWAARVHTTDLHLANEALSALQ